MAVTGSTPASCRLRRRIVHFYDCMRAAIRSGIQCPWTSVQCGVHKVYYRTDIDSP